MSGLSETCRLLDLLPDPMQVVEWNGRIVFANRPMRHLFGDVRGGLCWQVVKKSCTECDNCPRHRILACFGNRQTEIDTRIGRRMLVSHSTLAFDGRTYVLECYRDVTEYRRVLQAEARTRAELEVAREVQRRCMTVRLDRSRLHHVHRYLPARATTGDFLNAHVLDDGRIVLTVADVCGHGLGAASVTFMLKIAYDQLLADNVPLEHFPRELNRRLYRYLFPDRFLTLAMVCLEPDLHHGRLVNAGHPPVLHLRPDGPLDIHKARIPPVGILEDLPAEPPSLDLALAAGDRLLLYSDGLFETFDRSFEAFADAVGALAREPLGALLDALLPAGGDAFDDDITALAVEIPG